MKIENTRNIINHLQMQQNCEALSTNRDALKKEVEDSNHGKNIMQVLMEYRMKLGNP